MPIDKEDLIFRRAVIQDVDALLHMARQAFLQAYSSQNKPENVPDYLNRAFSKCQLYEELNEDASAFLLAELEGEIIGYVKVNFTPAQTDLQDPESMEIARLYVLEDFLGQGAGKFLLDQAINFAKQHHKNYVWLGVWEHNARAIRFYEKNGFTKFGTHPFPFGDEIQTDWLMKKQLKAIC